GAGVLHDRRRVDRRALVLAGQQHLEGAQRLVEVEFDGVVVDLDDIVGRLQQRLAQAADLAPAANRSNHVVSRQLLAVVEQDALAQRHGVQQAVVAHLVRLGQQRHDLEIGIPGEQRLVHVPGGERDDRRRRLVYVQRRRLADQRDEQAPAPDGFAFLRAALVTVLFLSFSGGGVALTSVIFGRLASGIVILTFGGSRGGISFGGIPASGVVIAGRIIVVIVVPAGRQQRGDGRGGEAEGHRAPQDVATSQAPCRCQRE